MSHRLLHILEKNRWRRTRTNESRFRDSTRNTSESLNFCKNKNCLGCTQSWLQRKGVGRLLWCCCCHFGKSHVLRSTSVSVRRNQVAAQVPPTQLDRRQKQVRIAEFSAGFGAADCAAAGAVLAVTAAQSVAAC